MTFVDDLLACLAGQLFLRNFQSGVSVRFPRLHLNLRLTPFSAADATALLFEVLSNGETTRVRNVRVFLWFFFVVALSVSAQASVVKIDYSADVQTKFTFDGVTANLRFVQLRPPVEKMPGFGVFLSCRSDKSPTFSMLVGNISTLDELSVGKAGTSIIQLEAAGRLTPVNIGGSSSTEGFAALSQLGTDEMERLTIALYDGSVISVSYEPPGEKSRDVIFEPAHYPSEAQRRNIGMFQQTCKLLY